MTWCQMIFVICCLFLSFWVIVGYLHSFCFQLLSLMLIVVLIFSSFTIYFLASSYFPICCMFIFTFIALYISFSIFQIHQPPAVIWHSRSIELMASLTGFLFTSTEFVETIYCWRQWAFHVLNQFIAIVSLHFRWCFSRIFFTIASS